MIWDAHACFPLKLEPDFSQLSRYRAAGVNFVSINIGMDMDPFEKVIQVLAGFRRAILAEPEAYVLVRTVEDVRAAQASGRLAVAFDLEGSEPLAGNLNMVSFYYDLGVRQMLLAYNTDNRASGGCLEGQVGLTAFGQQVILEMNRVGMLVDLAHMSEQATLEACELSVAPVIFSHANPKGVHPHARNLSDAQILACARTGGVVGINGIGDFLGGTDSATVVKHIEYVIDLAGAAHVGIGLDYVVDQQELIDYIQGNPDRFPPDRFKDFLAFVTPEQLPEIAGLLRQRGHSETVIRGVMGENFLRVAGQVWK